MAPKTGRGEKAEWRVVGEKTEAKPSESGAAKGSSSGTEKKGGKGKRGGKGKESAEETAAPWSKQADEEEDGSRRKPAKGKGRKGGNKAQAQAEDYYGEDDGSWGKGWSSGWDTGWDSYGGRQGGNNGEKPKSRNKGGGSGKRDGYSAVDYSQGPAGGDEDYYEGYDYGYGGSYGYAYGPDSWQPMPQQVEPAPPPPPPKKSEWTEYKTPEGDVYYHSSRTGLTQWDRPAELDPPKPPEPEPVPQGIDKNDGDVGHGRKGGGRGRGGDRGDDHERDDQRRGGGGGDGGARRNRDGGADGQRKGGRGGASKKEGGSMPKDKEASDFGPPGCNLFVFHLPDDWTDDDLHEYFAPHGSVVSAKVMKELGTGRSRGFGFVSYEDRVSAATAIKKMQGYKILGKRLKVEFKKGEMDGGALQDGQTDPSQEEDSGAPKKSYPDDERLIGYLRAISAKNVVTALKESENPESADASGAMDPIAADTEDAGFSMGADDAAEDAES
mmetsp:Transcript_28086/g.48834  ORF Transcript_28086/g.48834 Transcript_28086/m.48834 type:complete len:497 (-) Transcript_28086:108-1598(-)